MRSVRPRPFVLVTALLLALVCTARADDSTQVQIDWKEGPTTGNLQNIAEIHVPAGYLFTDKKGAQKILALTHNIASGSEVGVVAPVGDDEANSWLAYFDYSDIGYVKDDDKDRIDANALLKGLKESVAAGNEERRKHGWNELHVVGWARPPYYDSTTHNLTWGLLIGNQDGEESVNHSIRILGRRGTMDVDLVLQPEVYDVTVPRFDSLIAGFRFHEGNRYADFVKGDKVAEYGLAALVAGGAGAVALKTGLFAKLGKFLLLIVLALKKAFVVVIAGLFALLRGAFGWIRRLFGGGNVETVPDPSRIEASSTTPAPPRTPDDGGSGSGSIT